MPVPAEYVGKPFRQRAPELRWRKDGRGKSSTQTSIRPFDDGKQVFLDSDAKPTIVTFAADDAVNVPALLKSRAIVAWDPPRAASRHVEPEPAAEAADREGG